MSDSLTKYFDDYKNLINDLLVKEIKKISIPNQLKDSMLYSIQAGGKRIRPILLIASNEAYEHHLEKTLSSAVALEMIHTYSLIHDDLPAMDDDDYRRGQLTNHKAFNEATAILAGDALLTYSFELIADDPNLTAHEKITLIKLLSEKSGPKGMVAGQILDIESENKSIPLETLEEIHRLKTGELLTFAVIAGAFLGKATEEQLKHLETYSYYLGLIFQLQDDLLDVYGDEQKLGKPVGSDESKEKNTYPKLLGLEGTKQKMQDYVAKAKAALNNANASESKLLAITDYLTTRDH